MKRIFIVLALLLTLLSIVSLVSMGNLWLPLMVGLGSTIGIPMGLGYPFPYSIKSAMVFGLLAAVAAMFFGFRNHKKAWGQISAISGIILWAFIGLMGLGTGT